jgi:hypothetical protein
MQQRFTLKPLALAAVVEALIVHKGVEAVAALALIVPIILRSLVTRHTPMQLAQEELEAAILAGMELLAETQLLLLMRPQLSLAAEDLDTV